MRLSDTLRIEPGSVVAFVGAGGKSTAIRRLVTELAPQMPVVVTTSTKITLYQMDLAKTHRILDSIGSLEATLEQITPFESILLTAQMDENEPKWVGLGLDLIQKLIKWVRAENWVLLIEADGARGCSLKAPAEYEPVLPSDCDLVVPMVGLDAIGEEITSSKIHRADVLKRLLNLTDREEISVEHVVEVIRSSDGGLKDIPHTSDIRVLLNKADTNKDLENGSQIAEDLIQDRRIRSVLLASVKEESPVKESICRVAGIILAAGASTRLEGLKQLIPFRNKPLIAYSVEAALAGELDPVVVVVGKEGDPIREALKDHPIHIVENREPERGQSSSVIIGLEAVRDLVDATFFFLADMPLVASELVRALVEEHQRTLAPVIAPFAMGRRGNPVLFDRQTFGSLWQLKGDQGGRAIFSHYPIMQVDWDDSVLFDIDSEEDLQKLREIE